MGDKSLRVYHCLPARARSLAASVRGLHLRSWRYGSETARLIEEAHEREHWSAEQWKTWEESRRAYILQRAATQVPYYRDQWTARRRRGDRSSWEYLENWPILEKDSLRSNPAAFVADDCNVRRMFCEHTSGTTGTPLCLFLSKETLRAWYALFEARARHWNGVSRESRWAILGGQPIVPASAQRPPFWVWNGPMNQLYLSSNHISARNTSAYVGALNKYNVTHLVTYSSSVSLLAQDAYELGCKAVGLKAVITNAEPLLPRQREIIRQGLGCEARETYGMAEMVTAASECSASRLHIWPEVGCIEVLSDVEDAPSAPGSAGRLICTGLLNADMPLIRYALGDRGRIAAAPEECECRRALPSLESIDGRTNDVLVAPDGRRVYWLNPIFYDIPIQEAQIVQETLTQLCVRYVPAADFSPDAGQKLIQRLQGRLGDVQVVLERSDRIPRGPSGKFRAVVCNLPDVNVYDDQKIVLPSVLSNN